MRFFAQGVASHGAELFSLYFFCFCPPVVRNFQKTFFTWKSSLCMPLPSNLGLQTYIPMYILKGHGQTNILGHIRHRYCACAEQHSLISHELLNQSSPNLLCGVKEPCRTQCMCHIDNVTTAHARNNISLYLMNYSFDGAQICCVG